MPPLRFLGMAPKHEPESRRRWDEEQRRLFLALRTAVGRAISSHTGVPPTSPGVPRGPQGPGMSSRAPDGGSSRVEAALGPSWSASAGIRDGFAAVAAETRRAAAHALALHRPPPGSHVAPRVPGRGAGHNVGVRAAPSARGREKMGRCHHLSPPVASRNRGFEATSARQTRPVVPQ